MPQANPTGGANSERLENVTFPQARIDINDNLEALQTLNSGNSEPSTKAAFMQWLDTSSSPAVLKVRNAGNTSWIEVGSLSSSLYKSLGVTDVANGGTGATTAAAGIAALLPSQSGNSGKTLTTDGSALSWAVSSLGASVSTFSSNTTFTPETARSGFLFIIIGGGGSSGGGRSNNDDNPHRPAYSGQGGSGATALKFYSSSELGSSAVITVGSGGAASTGNGNSGGSSSVNPAGSGATCTAGGGGGSNYASAPSSGFTATAGGSAGNCSNHLLGWHGTVGLDGNVGNYSGPNPPEFTAYDYGKGGAGKHHPDAGGSTGNAGGAGYVVVFQW